MKRIACLVVVLFASTFAHSAEPSPGLKHVRPDAAAFIHVDASQVLQWKVAKALLGTGLIAGDELKQLKEFTGVGLEDVTSVTAFWPQLSQPRDTERVVVVLRFQAVVDVAAMMKKLDAEMTLDAKTGIITPKNLKREETIYIDTSIAKQLVIVVRLDRTYLKPADATATGTLSPAIKAASNGSALTVGISMMKMPDDIRGENIPPEARPFLPVFKSELLTIQGTFNPSAKDATDLFLNLSVESKDKASAGEVEKSFEAARTMLKSVIDAGYKELDPKKNKADADLFTPLLKRVEKTMTDAKVTTNDNTVTARMSMPVDIDLAPYIVRMKEAAERSKALNNLRQLGLATHNYMSAYNQFPPASTIDKKGKPMLSWRVLILPYIDEEELYKKFKLDEPWDSEHNTKVIKDNPMPKLFAIDGTKNMETKTTHYQVFVGNGAAFDPVKGARIQDFADGTSNTLLVVTAANAVTWTKPEDIEFDPKKDPRKLLLFTKGNSLVCFADGHVTSLKESILEATLKAFITRNGGEVVSPDD